jgi:hypothetical protein
MRKNIFLVDLENVPGPRLQELAAHDCEVHVFIGENAAKLPRELVLEMQKLGPKARYVEITGSGRNALDFHIAYYLGEYSARKDDTFFHIISKDTGFDPLVAHLKNKGFLLARSASIEETPLLRLSTTKTPSELVELIEERLRANPKNRPQRETTLASMIGNHFQKKLGEAEIAEIIQLLKSRGVFSVEGNKLKYAA